MTGKFHFAKPYLAACDRNTEFMKGVFSANIRLHAIVVNEFERVRMEKGFSQAEAVRQVKSNGGLISRQNLGKFRNGIFYTASTTYLNILARWSGYNDFVELVNVVDARSSGRKNTF